MMVRIAKQIILYIIVPFIGWTQSVQCDSSRLFLAASTDISLYEYSQVARINKNESYKYDSVEKLLSALISAKNLEEHNEVFEFPIATSTKDFE